MLEYEEGIIYATIIVNSMIYAGALITFFLAPELLVH